MTWSPENKVRTGHYTSASHGPVNGDFRGTRYRRQLTAPAPTVGSRYDQWVEEHPDGTDVGRLSDAEAGLLQTFPLSYPWQGGRVARRTQVGNAVPPLLARACIAEALGLEVT